LAREYSDGVNTYVVKDNGDVEKTRGDGSKVTIPSGDSRMQYIPTQAGGAFSNPKTASVSRSDGQEIYTVGNRSFMGKNT
jgi:hypothetical protein